MNIIYKLTNLENGKAYIGQKMQCHIAEIDGVPTIISSNRSTIYLGSSSNVEMIEALKKKVRFKAEVLEEIPDKYRGTPFPFEREEYWMRKFNAVESDEFYNLSYPLYDKRGVKGYINSIKNIYGETYKEFTNRASTISRRVKTIESLGFQGFKDFYKFVLKSRSEGLNDAEISRSLGKHRHFISSMEEYSNFKKVLEELDNTNEYHVNKAKFHRMRGASIKQVAIELELEVETVYHLLGTLKNIPDPEGKMKVSDRMGITSDELGYRVIKRLKEGMAQKEIATDLGIRPFEVRRYLERFIREHIDLSEFDGMYKKE